MLDSAHVIVNNGEGDLEAYRCKSYSSHITIIVIKHWQVYYISHNHSFQFPLLSYLVAALILVEGMHQR